MVNFGLSEHYLILEKLCQTCGEQLKKAKDKYENSFLGAGKREIIFLAFGVKMWGDDRDTCPPKFCHKCYKPTSRGGTCLTINVWSPHNQSGDCVICSSHKDQQKLRRKRKPKPGLKPKHYISKHDYYINFQPLDLIKRTRARKTTDEVTKKLLQKDRR